MMMGHGVERSDEEVLVVVSYGRSMRYDCQGNGAFELEE